MHSVSQPVCNREWFGGPKMEAECSSETLISSQKQTTHITVKTLDPTLINKFLCAVILTSLPLAKPKFEVWGQFSLCYFKADK
jgi:hypothetical protein